MKLYILTILAASLFGVACNTNPTASSNQDSTVNTSTVDVENAAVITFEKDNFDFGTLKQGDKVTHEYKFTNTGKTPLIITDATATCGCTIPEYSKDPVAPGQAGIIKVVFNSAGKSGKQHKVITITSNANPPVAEVYLVGDIKTPTTTPVKN